MQHLIETDDFELKEILSILDDAKRFKKERVNPVALLRGGGC
ncbi:MAG: hypothetical protein P8Y49_10450 [Sulfurovaceae bacterium]